MAGRNLAGQARLIQTDPLPRRYVDFAAQAELDLELAQAVRISLLALKILADPGDLGSKATEDLVSILPVLGGLDRDERRALSWQYRALELL